MPAGTALADGACVNPRGQRVRDGFNFRNVVAEVAVGREWTEWVVCWAPPWRAGLGFDSGRGVRNPG
jgi:hypothetical protein